MIDPFTQVFRFILDKLKNDNKLRELVNAENFVDFTRGDPDPLTAANLSPSDFPQVMLMPLGGPINLHSTSSTATIEQNYDLLIATAEMMLADTDQTESFYFPLKWHLLRVLNHITMQTDFKSTDVSFKIQNIDVTDQSMQWVGNKGNEGWNSVFTIKCTLEFDRSIFTS